MTLDIGVDIGGTFTDLVAIDSVTGEMFQAKSLTTPHDLSEGVFACLDKVRGGGKVIRDVDTLVHGSTIAINIAIEKKGARCALVVTRGARDVYAIGRGNRPAAYDPFFKRPRPLIPRRLTFEVAERKLASGETAIALAEDHAEEVAAAVASAGVDAVAVCFLHAYADPEHELLMGRALRRALPEAHISLSHEIVREYREYERTSTTALNAYVGPRTREYLSQIDERLRANDFGGQFLVMQSNGGVMSLETAQRTPVTMMESGPVGGVIASAQIGALAGFRDVITFDMGGTTAKASLIRDAEPAIVHGYHIGGYASGQPVMMPVVDIVEVGAGGGSIAWIDEVGAFKVGPHSAGADPGPICYGRGGTEPTVTDANVVLGRIGADSFLGGEMVLDTDAAREGIERCLGSLGLQAIETAIGMVQLAVAQMVLAVRSISVERGHDPRDFALIAQGGNGPLHAVEIARELGIRSVVVPRLPAIFSAVGMLGADLRHDYVQTNYVALAEADLPALAAILDRLVESGCSQLESEGVAHDDMSFTCSLDLRYVGQEFALPTPVDRGAMRTADQSTIRAPFDEVHLRRFGYATHEEPVELVNLRVVARGTRHQPQFPPAAHSGTALTGHRPVSFDDPAEPINCPVYARAHLCVGDEVPGPAVIEEPTCTTLLWQHDLARVAEGEELLINVGQPA